MYVIFPAEEVVYLTYGYRYPKRVNPRPTLDTLPSAAIPIAPLIAPLAAPPPAPAPVLEPAITAETRPTDVFNYSLPNVETERNSSRVSAPSSDLLNRPPSAASSKKLPPAKPEKKSKLKFLSLSQDNPDFGRVVRSPDIENFERPVPLTLPAFSRKAIYDRDFDALFEVAHTPEFCENLRVTASSSSPEADDRGDPFAPSPPPSALDPLTARSSQEAFFDYKPQSPEESKQKKVSFFTRKTSIKQSRVIRNKMAASTGSEGVLRELTNPALNEQLKNHNAVTFKLVKTVSDFTSQLSQVYEQHASELQVLVATFRKRNGELRKERHSCPSSLFQTWETLLQEVEADSAALSGTAAALERQVSRPLIERTFHRKLQSRKLFAHRDGCETIIAKTEEKLTKTRQDYKATYAAYCSLPSPQNLGAYFDAHNAYVQQLHSTNGMLDEYNQETLPQILQELEDIYSDLCNTLSDAILQGAEVVTARAGEQSRRYDTLMSACRGTSASTDLASWARVAAAGAALPAPRAPRRPYAPPQATAAAVAAADSEQFDQPENAPPQLKNELILDRLGPQQIRSNYESLKKEANDLDMQIKQLQDALDALVRIQAKSLESCLFNKVNELQEDISMKKFDYRVAQIHLAAIKAQKELFTSRADANAADRKMSSSSSGSMKTKWLKAFKSLKPAPSAPPPSVINPERKNGAGGRDATRFAGDSDAHNFQEYTYKKITPCDICSQVLRGHTRQGLRCRLCKMNVHADCMSQVGKCQTKSKLLRRQKSTSEIESRLQDTALEEENFGDEWLPGQRLSSQLSFNLSDDYYVDDNESVVDEFEGTSSRPFGQPLCFTQENGDQTVNVKTKKGSVRKKK